MELHSLVLNIRDNRFSIIIDQSTTALQFQHVNATMHIIGEMSGIAECTMMVPMARTRVDFLLPIMVSLYDSILRCFIITRVLHMGVAREERVGRTTRGAGLEGTLMMPTSSTKLLFYRIILVYFSKKSIVNWRFGAPSFDKKQIRSSKNMEMFGPDGPPLLKHRSTKYLFCFK